LYIEEVVEACNRLKGGKLPKEKLKTQLQKIASSRTGGAKTDEALGKTGGGPEGLPHSIIVTAEGVEGETELATQVEADQATAAPTPEPDLLGDEPSVAEESKGKGKKSAGAKKKEAKLPKGKASQMRLFEPPNKPDRRDRPNRPASASKSRGKK
jgi:DNA topoisomerase-6 subunit B